MASNRVEPFETGLLKEAAALKKASQSCIKHFHPLNPEQGTLGTLLESACMAHVGVDYLRGLDAAKKALRANLLEDLNDICLADAASVPSLATAFARTRAFIKEWHRPTFRLESIPEKLIQQAIDARLLEPDQENQYRILINPGAFPLALSLFSNAPITKEFRKSYSELGTLCGRDVEVLPSRHSALQTVLLLSERDTRSEMFIFASSALVILPNALEPNHLTHDFVENYIGVLSATPKRRGVFYLWNYRLTATLLRLTYEKTPGVQRFQHLWRAIERLASFIDHENFTMGYYDTGSSTAQTGFDWRDALSFVDQDNLVLVFRDLNEYTIETGIKVHRQFWADLIGEISERHNITGLPLTAQGEVMINQWFQSNEKDLRSLGKILWKKQEVTMVPSRDTGPRAKSTELAREVVFKHLSDALADPKVYLTVADYQKEKALAYKLDRLEQEQKEAYYAEIAAHYRSRGLSYERPQPLTPEEAMKIHKRIAATLAGGRHLSEIILEGRKKPI